MSARTFRKSRLLDFVEVERLVRDRIDLLVLHHAVKGHPRGHLRQRFVRPPHADAGPDIASHDGDATALQAPQPREGSGAPLNDAAARLEEPQARLREKWLLRCRCDRLQCKRREGQPGTLSALGAELLPSCNSLRRAAGRTTFVSLNRGSLRISLRAASAPGNIRTTWQCGDRGDAREACDEALASHDLAAAGVSLVCFELRARERSPLT